MKETIGFIGCGKMAQAMIGGMLKSGIVGTDQIIASARTLDSIEEIEEKWGIRTTINNRFIATEADRLFIAVAPVDYTAVIDSIRDEVKPNTIIITIAAGVTIEEVETAFGRRVKVIRSMPNTPSLVGEGMTAICRNNQVNDEEYKAIEKLLSSIGKVARIVEGQMDAIPAISGSSPAYVFMMIEAMADGGVRQGLGRKEAYQLAAQAVLGAAKMVLETGEHPGALKDRVTSPGGSTIAAVSRLEQEQFRGAILAAMEACTDKVKEMATAKGKPAVPSKTEK